MADVWGVNNPGIDGLDELTVDEESLVQSIASITYEEGDFIYYGPSGWQAKRYITVSATEPLNPEVGDLWVDIL